MASPNDARVVWVPPTQTIVDASGVVWSLGAGQVVLRGGIATNGHGTQILWHNGAIYVCSPRNAHWWVWLGNNGWSDLGTQDPAAPLTKRVYLSWADLKLP